ncbi:hypothetical protein C8Q80DRAFT_1090749 [Daedaleopsis nitida]|nr:hypothetical protein C8Q80DRAFT_1090749 [Daedaleopsis nitida]
MQSSEGVEIDEVVLRLQGYMVEGKLPPIRQHHIPHNPNRLISLQESVTLTGLNCQSFDLAVQAIKAIHQQFARHVSGLQGMLRDWLPGQFDGAFTVTFGNRYLSSAREAGGDSVVDLSKVVDPYNVMQPILLQHTEVHVAENVVEHWERSKMSDAQGYTASKVLRIKPDVVNVSQLLKVQVSFVAVKVGR